MIDRMRELQQAAPEIEAAAVVSVDGLPITSILPENVSPDRVAAMSAAMLSLGEGFCRELKRGTLEQVHVKGQYGHVILMAVGEKAVLTILASEQAKLGILFLELRRSVTDLQNILEQQK